MPTFAADSIVRPLVAATPLLASLLLLTFVRTRRVPCPATCRRCGYDVSRRPADSARCSECGADLTLPKATRTTRRVRKRRSQAVALFFVAASAHLLILQALHFGWTAWYLKTAPDDWIAAHAERGTGPFATRAFDEWRARYRFDRLPAASQSRFFEYLLAWQADLSRPWDPAMGDLLLVALRARRLSEQQCSRFVLGSVAIRRLRTRPAIRPGDPVAVEFDMADRGVTPSRSRYVLREVHASFRGPPDPADERTLVFGGHPGGWRVLSPKMFRGFVTPQGAGTTALAAGTKARLHIAVSVKLLDSGLQLQTDALQQAVLRETRDVDVLAPGTPLGRPVKDPKVADAVASAVRVAVERHSSGQVFADVRLDAAPPDRSFDVYVAQGATRRLLTRRRAAANDADASHDELDGVEHLVPLDIPSGTQTVRLILVAGGEALRESADQDQYWSGTIVFPSILVGPANGVQAFYRPSYDILPED